MLMEGLRAQTKVLRGLHVGDMPSLCRRGTHAAAWASNCACSASLPASKAAVCCTRSASWAACCGTCSCSGCSSAQAACRASHWLLRASRLPGPLHRRGVQCPRLCCLPHWLQQAPQRAWAAQTWPLQPGSHTGDRTAGPPCTLSMGPPADPPPCACWLLRRAGKVPLVQLALSLQYQGLSGDGDLLFMHTSSQQNSRGAQQQQGRNPHLSGPEGWGLAAGASAHCTLCSCPSQRQAPATRQPALGMPTRGCGTLAGCVAQLVQIAGVYLCQARHPAQPGHSAGQGHGDRARGHP